MITIPAGSDERLVFPLEVTADPTGTDIEWGLAAHPDDEPAQWVDGSWGSYSSVTELADGITPDVSATGNGGTLTADPGDWWLKVRYPTGTQRPVAVVVDVIRVR